MAEPKNIGELIQIKIIEQEKIVEVPKFVEKIIEVPRYVDVEYERPVIKEVTYEKPILVPKDLTAGLKDFIQAEVQKGLGEIISSLKVSFEIPMSRILQVRPGGKKTDVGGI